MSNSLHRRRQRTFEIWPGYVDALASMLMMIAVVLLVMVAAQFSLASAISSKDVALTDLTLKLRSITAALTAEQASTAELRAANLELSSAKERANREISALTADLTSQRSREQLLQDEHTALSVTMATLNEQLAALTAKLGVLTADLTTAQDEVVARDTKINDLDLKLKAALTQRVEELAEYRSEFFGKLKKALGNRGDVRVVGDRFVFQSEVLFPSGSADLQASGKDELLKIANTLKTLADSIPQDVDWILTVIGHTDRRPISTALFPSNWELSTARALSVVKFLTSAGIPAKRLAATGYGEHQPLDSGTDEAALSKNRRIELKFNQK
jgi:chemotaxis protein MotB